MRLQIFLKKQLKNGKVRTMKHSCMTSELLDLCDEKSKLKSILRKCMKDTKEKWIGKKELLSIDQHKRNSIHSKRAYQTLKALTNSSTKKQTRLI